MSIDISLLSETSNAAISASNLLLATPNQESSYTPNSDPTDTFLFNYEGEQSIVLSSDVTDHYIEDNTAIQDQVAIKPEVINTLGYIGELNDITPPALKALKTAADKLTVLSAYVPSLSASALIAYNTAFQAYQLLALGKQSYISRWGTTEEKQNKQQQAFTKLQGYFNKRTLFTVVTPWAKFDNMVIMSLRAIQGEDTRTVSSFEVTFKKMRFANIAVTDVQATGRAAVAKSPASNLGVSPVQLSSTNLLNISGLTSNVSL